MAAGGGNKTLVDDFEAAFQNCYATLVNQENVGHSDVVEIKGNAEQSIQQMFEKARQLDQFFVQKRLILSHKNPQHVVKEDMQELKLELLKKDTLIQKYYDKLQHWQVLLRNVQGGQDQGQSSQPANQSQQFQPQVHPFTNQSQQQITPQPAMGGYNHGTTSQPHGNIPPRPTSQGYPQGPLAFLEQTTSNIR